MTAALGAPLITSSSNTAIVAKIVPVAEQRKMRPVLKMIQDSGWPMPISLEYEYKGADAVDEVRKMLDYCNRALNL